MTEKNFIATKPMLNAGWRTPKKPPFLEKGHCRHDKPFIVTGVDGCVYTAYYARVSTDGTMFGVKFRPKWWVKQSYNEMNEKVIKIKGWMELPPACV